MSGPVELRHLEVQVGEFGRAWARCGSIEGGGDIYCTGSGGRGGRRWSFGNSYVTACFTLGGDYGAGGWEIFACRGIVIGYGFGLQTHYAIEMKFSSEDQTCWT